MRTAPTLAMVALEAFEARKAELKNDGKSGRWFSPLELHVLPKIGRVPVEEIDQQDIKTTLAPIWHEKAETARKAMNRLGIVMRYAAAMDWREVSTFYSGLNEGSMTHLALRLLILTAARSMSSAMMPAPFAQHLKAWRGMQTRTISSRPCRRRILRRAKKRKCLAPLRMRRE